MTKLTTAKVAETVGVNAETLRYYERVGLVSSPTRSQGGHRIYTQDDIEKLKSFAAPGSSDSQSSKSALCCRILLTAFPFVPLLSNG